MTARIGVMRAMDRGQVREFTDAKGHHWGRRKLKRDQWSLSTYSRHSSIC